MEGMEKLEGTYVNIHIIHYRINDPVIRQERFRSVRMSIAFCESSLFSVGRIFCFHVCRCVWKYACVTVRV